MTSKHTIQSLGGKARAESLSEDERKSQASKAALARWAPNLPKATHDGELGIGDSIIACAVLENGTRVITQSGLLRSLGRSERPHGGAYEESEGFEQLPVFLRSKSLKPFISQELLASSHPIEFIQVRNGKALGFKAELLPLVCDAFLQAREAKALPANQMATAKRCEILVRSLAKVGITALVDEATGYQEIRDRQALQVILDKYLRHEYAKWARCFPADFYQEMFRLHKWEWRGMKVGKPQCVGAFTKDIVYERLAPGLLKELETKNPRNENGNRKVKHHQYFTEEVGHPALAQHLHAVIGLMRASDSWPAFKRMIDRAFPKQGETLMLPMDLK